MHLNVHVSLAASILSMAALKSRLIDLVRYKGKSAGPVGAKAASPGLETYIYHHIPPRFIRTG